MGARAKEPRLHLHRANEGALRWDSRRELSRKLFGRADRLAFFERTVKASIDRDGAETVHPRRRCYLVPWDAFAMAARSNFRTRLWALCPGWGKDGRMNQGRSHAYFP